MLLFWHILDQQRPRHIPPFDDRLIHAENVAAPLRFISTQRPWGVQNTRRNQPTGASLEPISAAEVEDSVVAFVPIFQTTANIFRLRARFEPHERISKVVVDVVQLWREIITFRLPFLADQRRVFETLVHVVRNRPHVVKELGIDRPAVVLVENRFADDVAAAFGDSILQQKLLPFEQTEAEPFVPHSAFVRRFGGAAEPTLVDPAPVGTESVIIARVQLDSASGVQERSRHPGRRQSQQTIAGVHRRIENRCDAVAFDQTFIEPNTGHQTNSGNMVIWVAVGVTATLVSGDRCFIVCDEGLQECHRRIFCRLWGNGCSRTTQYRTNDHDRSDPIAASSPIRPFRRFCPLDARFAGRWRVSDGSGDDCCPSWPDAVGQVGGR